jgi:hypothetical protein
VVSLGCSDTELQQLLLVAGSCHRPNCVVTTDTPPSVTTGTYNPWSITIGAVTNISSSAAKLPHLAVRSYLIRGLTYQTCCPLKLWLHRVCVCVYEERKQEEKKKKKKRKKKTWHQHYSCDADATRSTVIACPGCRIPSPSWWTVLPPLCCVLGHCC